MFRATRLYGWQSRLSKKLRNCYCSFPRAVSASGTVHTRQPRRRHALRNRSKKRRATDGPLEALATGVDRRERNAGSIVQACGDIKHGRRFETDVKISPAHGRNLRHVPAPSTAEAIRKIVRLAIRLRDRRVADDSNFQVLCATNSTRHKLNTEFGRFRPWHKRQTKNFRTHFERLIERAGVDPWPKPWQNLRVTREHEMMYLEGHPKHCVVKWLGHAGKTYSEQYDAGIQESDFLAYKSRTGRPDAGQQGGASARTSDDLKEQQKKKPGFQVGAAVCSQPESGQAPPVGLEPTTRRLTAACSTN